MKRRAFLKNTLKLAPLLAVPPACAAITQEPPVTADGLHYAMLHGRELRDIALKKLHHGDGRFVNPLGIARDGRFFELLRWKFTPNAYREHLDAQPVQTVNIDWEPVIAHKGLSVTFIKHSSILIQDNGTTLLIDPVFDSIFWFIKDFSPLAPSARLMPKPDHVLITHGHYDHLDIPTLKTFASGTHVISPLGYTKEFAEAGLNNRTQLDWFQKTTVNGIEITLLPCNHWTMRNPFEGPNTSLWGSFLIRSKEGYTFYISGDTAYFDGYDQLAHYYDVDLAVMNLGAYAPRWFMKQSHMDPAETLTAFQQLQANKLMILHWGTFQLGDEPVHFPPEDMRKVMQNEGEEKKLITLPHGNTLFL